MTVNDSVYPGIAVVVQLAATDGTRGAETDAIDRQSHIDRRIVMRLDPEIMLDEPGVMDRLIRLSHCHVLRIVRGIFVRKLVVKDRHQMIMTEITLIAITDIVTAADVAVAADPDGDASLLRTTILLMTVITVTSTVVAVHQNLTR